MPEPTDLITGLPVNLSTTTDSTGHYTFSGLTKGTYTLSETLQDGWYAVTSPVLTPTLACSGNLTNQNFTNVTVWEHGGEDAPPRQHTEDLIFETVHPTQRSYK